MKNAILALFAAAVTVSVTHGQSPAQPQPLPSPDIHYVATPNEVVDAMLTVAGVTSRDVVYDLGSGDGRIVIEAARKYGARGVGIEIDSSLVKAARDKARKAGVDHLVTFSQADLFKTDLSPATVLTLYLSPSINLRLESKIKRELKPGARVVSHRFPIGAWKADQELMVGRNRVLFWRVP